MSNVLQRDLSLSMEAAQARRLKGFETQLERPAFRPWTKMYGGAETGANTTLTPINSIGAPAITETGLYFFSATSDMGNLVTGFGVFYLLANGGTLQDVVVGPGANQRVPGAVTWSGAVSAGTTVYPAISHQTSGGLVAYNCSFQVVRLA